MSPEIREELPPNKRVIFLGRKNKREVKILSKAWDYIFVANAPQDFLEKEYPPGQRWRRVYVAGSLAELELYADKVWNSKGLFAINLCDHQ